MYGGHVWNRFSREFAAISSASESFYLFIYLLIFPFEIGGPRISGLQLTSLKNDLGLIVLILHHKFWDCRCGFMPDT